MGMPISIRLDDHVRTELEAQAQAQGVGLATLLRDLAADAARQLRRARIRGASEAVGVCLAGAEAGKSFYADWGSAGGTQG